MRLLFDEYGRGSLPRLPSHRNPGLEIVYLQHGRLVWKCDGKAETVPPDSVYFTLPWQEHGSVSEFEPGHHWYFVVLRLGDEKRKLNFPKVLGLDKATERTVRQVLLHARRHSWPATPLIRALMPALVEELERPGPLHRARVIQMAGQLVLELARLLSMPDAAAKEEETVRLSQLVAELQRTCGEPWTLSQMAERLQLRRTRFSALFRHHTGDTPLHYLLRLRIEEARRLLQTTDRSITEIALSCGFASSQHFARVFQQFTGVTATAYREHGPPALHLPRGPDCV